MVVECALKRDGEYWEATCTRFKTVAFSRDRTDALNDLYVAVLLEIALMAQDGTVFPLTPLEFRLLDAKVI